MIPHGFDDLNEAAHRHVADEIEHSHASSEHGEPGHHAWVEAALKFAGHVAAELTFEYLPIDSILSAAAPVSSEHLHGSQGLHSVGATDGHGFSQQTTAFTCAVVSQKMILDQFGIVDPQTGQPVSESLLVFEATSHGWLTENGTSLHDMPNLLELHGISCHHGHDWKHLVSDLAHGHQVAIAVNSDELWHDSPWSTLLHQILPGRPDHAVVLKGLHVDSHGHVSVVINDPGRPDGAGVEYSLEKFQAALGNGSFHYIATDLAPPGWEQDAGLDHALARYHGVEDLSLDHANAELGNQGFAEYITEMDDQARCDFLRNI